MKNLREATHLLHRTTPPGHGLAEADLLRVIEWLEHVVTDLDRLHRERRWHGAVGPDLVGVRGGRARLATPGREGPPPEFVDPEWQRLRLKAGVRDPAFEARQDVYGAGSLLYFVLENGAPPCGSRSALTRSVPAALAWIVYRAMADGSGRYPTARAMLEDLGRLRRLARGRSLEAVRPEELPSWRPGESAPPARLTPYRVAARRERRGTFALVLLAALAVAVLGAFWSRAGSESAVSEVRAAPSAPAEIPTVRGLLETWRERLADRLSAAGERLDPFRVPLVVASDVRLRGDLGWARHPSARLASEVARAMDGGAAPEEIGSLLRSRAGDATVPAALRVRVGDRPGTLDVVLDYRGLRLRGVARAR